MDWSSSNITGDVFFSRTINTSTIHTNLCSPIDNDSKHNKCREIVKNDVLIINLNVGVAERVDVKYRREINAFIHDCFM